VRVRLEEVCMILNVIGCIDFLFIETIFYNSTGLTI